MAARSAWLLLCLLGGATQFAAAQEAKPLISADIVYSTYDLLSEVCSTGYKKAGVDDLLKKVPWDEITTQYNAVYAKLPPPVQEAIPKITDGAYQVKVTVLEKASVASAAMEGFTAQAVDKIESAVPMLKGMIGKGTANVVMFFVYMLVVLYVAVKVALFVLRLVKGIFCFCCCCGCCGGSKPKTEGGKKGKADNVKAPNGKATPTKKK